jgi:hypothetical protein
LWRSSSLLWTQHTTGGVISRLLVSQTGNLYERRYNTMAKNAKGPFKSASSGKFVTEKYATANPGKTYGIGGKKK